jgi:hypothetical protein
MILKSGTIMPSQKIESDNEQIKNIKEETNRIVQQQQQQQIVENTTTTTTATSNISNTTNAGSNINENQKINKEILENSIDIINRYQQLTIKTIKATAENYNQLQNNILNTHQSAFSKLIDDAPDNKSYNFAVLEQLKMYIKINQNIIDSTINNTRTIHESLGEYTETFNKSIELAQQYYSGGIKNYFNFGKKIERI